MEKNKPKFESSIERKNVRITAEIGSRAIVFDYMNTTIYEFPEPYQDFKHAFRYDENEKQSTYFFAMDVPEVIQVLKDNNFPTCY